MTTPRSNSPIVLVHGIFGFSRLGIAGVSVEYFRRIPAALRAAGRIVPDPPSLRTAGSIVERAEDLKTYMETAPGVAGQRVHLIAHSLEGLDARWMISKLNMAERVLSLTTIGLPIRAPRSPISSGRFRGSMPSWSTRVSTSRGWPT